MPRTWWVAILMGVAAASAPIGMGAQQEDTEQSQKRERWGRKRAQEADLENRPRLSEKTTERHARAIELLFEERYDEAEQELSKLYFNRLNVVEQARIHLDFAYVASARDDTAEARRRLEAAIAVEDGLLPDARADARFQIAMLWMQDENWSMAAQTLETWFTEAPDPNPRSYYILSLCYYQQGDFARALPAVQKVVDEADEPKEAWLQLLLALYLLEKQYEQGIPILERLISLYPKKSYFTSLSTIYGALGSFEDAAVPLQLAYDLELLTDDSDLRRLAQLLMFLSLPYRSGEILKNGLESDLIAADSDVLAMLSNSWIAAREYDASVAPLERAASLAPDGNLYVRLAQVYVQQQKWDDAANALERSFDKGDLDDPADATLLMGITLYSKGDITRARGWFRRAGEFEATRGEANTWIQHIDQELAESQAEM